MANGTIAFDTLTTSDSANTGTEKSIDTSYLFNGVSKHWLNLDGTGTIAISDSFNCASVTDDGTGDYDPFFTSNMSNTEYSGVGTCPSGAGDHSVLNISTLATNKYRMVVSDGNQTLEDTDPAMTQVQGDLA
tara:strand:+ start:777 stop:1172 length:396 start_codon:yes stop_codon:yes gene_type:complete